MWALCCVYEQLHRYYDPDRAQVSTFVDKVLNTASRRLLLQKVPYQDAVGSCPPESWLDTENSKQMVRDWHTRHKNLLRLSRRPWEALCVEYEIDEKDYIDDQLVAGESMYQQNVRVTYSELVIVRILALLADWCEGEGKTNNGERDSGVWIAYRLDDTPGPEVMQAYGINTRQRLSQILNKMDIVVRHLVWADPESIEALETAIDYEVDQ